MVSISVKNEDGTTVASQMCKLFHFVRARCPPTVLLILPLVASLSVLTSGCGQSPGPPQTSNSNGSISSKEKTDSSAEDRSESEAEDTKQLEASTKPIQEKKDPRVDGWTTEVWNEAASKKLSLFGHWLSSPLELAVEDVRSLVSDDLEATRLFPMDMNLRFDGEVKIESGQIGEQLETLQASDFIARIQDFAAKFKGSSNVHFKFKITSVTELPLENVVQTVALFQADSYDSQSSVQINCVWTCQWNIATGELVLKSLKVSDYEEIQANSAGGHLFADCTKSVFDGVDSFDAQLMKGTNHWRRRMQASLGIDLFGHQGLAIGDVNGDGLDDLYVCQPGGVVNRLYLQNEDGTVSDQSHKSSVDFLDRSRSAMFVDFDNDDDQDLAIVVDSDLIFLSNDGGGKFQFETSLAIGTSVTLAAADYDLDGDVDLYVCGYSAPRGGEGAPTPYHDANNGLPNHLLRNEISDDQWLFRDVTEQVGLNENNSRYTLSASWEDFDGDGDQDLYVANDFGRNNLYRNDDGEFTDIAASAGVEDISAGMGVCWGDFNQDGKPDIYVSNMFSSAGNRIAYQRKFRVGDSDAMRKDFQRHARGNSLFENMGDGTFRDVSETAGVTMGRWSWGSLFFDLNNDSYEDILVTNGLITNEDSADL